MECAKKRGPFLIEGDSHQERMDRIRRQVREEAARRPDPNVLPEGAATASEAFKRLLREHFAPRIRALANQDSLTRKKLTASFGVSMRSPRFGSRAGLMLEWSGSRSSISRGMPLSIASRRSTIRGTSDGTLATQSQPQDGCRFLVLDGE